MDGTKTRKICPNCSSDLFMLYCFPGKQKDPCAERQAWRFQRCGWCGWRGDVVTHEPMVINTVKGTLVINGVLFERGLAEYVYVVGICPDNGLDEGVHI